MGDNKFFDAQEGYDTMLQAGKDYQTAMQEVSQVLLNKANSQNSDYISSDTPNTIQYKPSFWTKLGESMQGQGSNIQKGYIQAAEFNAKMRESRAALKAQHEGYARRRRAQMLEKVAGLKAEAGKAGAYAEADAFKAGQQTALAGAQKKQADAATARSQQLMQRETDRANELSAWYQGNDGNFIRDLQGIMYKSSPDGTMYGLSQDPDENGGIGPAKPSVITTPEQVMDTANTARRALLSMPPSAIEQQKQLSAQIDEWQQAHLDILTNGGKLAKQGSEEAMRAVQAAISDNPGAPALTPGGVASAVSSKSGTVFPSDYFSEVDVATLEDFNKQELVDYEKKAKQFDDEFRAGKWAGDETRFAQQRAGLQFLVDVKHYSKKGLVGKAAKEALQFLMLPGNLEEGALALAEAGMPQEQIAAVQARAREKLGVVEARTRFRQSVVNRSTMMKF